MTIKNRLIKSRRRLSLVIIFLIFIGVFLLELIRMIIFPSLRPFPWGTGLPSGWVEFISNDGKYSLQYPQTWKVYESHQRTSSEPEKIASIYFPSDVMAQRLTIYRRPFDTGNIQDVVHWGQNLAAKHKNGGIIPGILEPYNTPNFQGFLYHYEYPYLPESLFGKIECISWYIIEGWTSPDWLRNSHKKA